MERRHVKYFNERRARRMLAEAKVDCILLTQPNNFIAFSGFTAVSSFAFIDRPSIGLYFADPARPPALLVPNWDFADVQATSWIEDVRQYAEHRPATKTSEMRDWRGELLDMLRQHGDVSTIGVEERFIAKWIVDALIDAFPTKRLVPATDLIRRIRAVKTASEIALLKQATDVTMGASAALIEASRPGISEIELAKLYRSRVGALGGQETDNFVIGFGPAGFVPHAVPSENRLKRGQLMRFDLGAKVRGYHGDTARCRICGEASDRERQIYNAILAAEQEAAALLRPGIEAGAIYARAVEVARKTLPEFHMEHVGHGLGVEQHETPGLVLNGCDLIETNMVINVETLFFERGFGGFAVEDTYLITETGADCWTDLDRNLEIEI